MGRTVSKLIVIVPDLAAPKYVNSQDDGNKPAVTWTVITKAQHQVSVSGSSSIIHSSLLVKTWRLISWQYSDNNTPHLQQFALSCHTHTVVGWPGWAASVHVTVVQQREELHVSADKLTQRGLRGASSTGIHLICLLEKEINVSPLSQRVLETSVFVFGFSLRVRLSGAKMHLQQINTLNGLNMLDMPGRG